MSPVGNYQVKVVKGTIQRDLQVEAVVIMALVTTAWGPVRRIPDCQ